MTARSGPPRNGRFSAGGQRPGDGQPQAIVLVLGSAFSLQFGAALAVLLLQQIGAVGAVTLRLAFAALVLIVIARPRLRSRSRSDLALVVVFGLVLGTMNLSFYEAAARLPLGVAVTLEFLGPLGLAVAMSRRLRDVVWVLLAGVGVFLLGDGRLANLDPAGVAFALGAAACWAGYILLGSRVSRRYAKADGLAVGMVVAAAVAIPLGSLSAGAALLDPRALAFGVGVAVLSSVLPYSLEMSALRRIPPRTFGVLMSLEPAVAALAGFLVLDQLLSHWQLVAIGLVVVASAGATWAARAGPASAD